MFIKKVFIYFSLIILTLTLTSCSMIHSIKPTNSIVKTPVPQYVLDKIIKEKVEPISTPTSCGGRPFCVYKIISYEKTNNIIKVYLSLFAQEYYVKNNRLLSGSGGQSPAILILKKDNNNYKFVTCNISTAAGLQDSLQIFPQNIRKKVAEASEPDSTLLNYLKKKAANYFKSTKELK